MSIWTFKSSKIFLEFKHPNSCVDMNSCSRIHAQKKEGAKRTQVCHFAQGQIALCQYSCQVAHNHQFQEVNALYGFPRHPHTCAQTHTHMHRHMLTHRHVCTYAYVQIRMCLIRTCTQTCAHTCMSTDTQANNKNICFKNQSSFKLCL